MDWEVGWGGLGWWGLHAPCRARLEQDTHPCRTLVDAPSPHPPTYPECTFILLDPDHPDSEGAGVHGGAMAGALGWVAGQTGAGPVGECNRGSQALGITPASCLCLMILPLPSPLQAM